MAKSSRAGRRRWATSILIILSTSGGIRALGQDPPPPTAGDRGKSGAEPRLRFTPKMAEGIGRLYTKEVLKRRYELPDDRADEAADLIARRLMSAVHGSEEQALAVAEFYMTRGLEFAADMREGKTEFYGIPPDLARGLAQRITPTLPAVRELIKNVGQDIRPMLPLKQQLKLAADLMTVHAGVDAFEETMKRWSKGEVDPFENPFRGSEREIKVDENGESEALKNARKQAENMLKSAEYVSKWEKYVERAKELYEFDDSQSATADSILRETLDGAERITADELRQKRLYRNRLWSQMIWRLEGGWRSPMRQWIEIDQQALNQPIEDLGQDMMRRIDEVPTASQRQRAEEHVRATLADKGFGDDAIDGGNAQDKKKAE